MPTVNKLISYELQQVLWDLSETAVGEEKPYAQIFRLYPENGILQVEHEHLYLPYKRTKAVPGFELVTTEIWVVDESPCTWMWHKNDSTPYWDADRNESIFQCDNCGRSIYNV